MPWLQVSMWCKIMILNIEYKLGLVFNNHGYILRASIQSWKVKGKANLFSCLKTTTTTTATTTKYKTKSARQGLPNCIYWSVVPLAHVMMLYFHVGFMQNECVAWLNLVFMWYPYVADRCIVITIHILIPFMTRDMLCNAQTMSINSTQVITGIQHESGVWYSDLKSGMKWAKLFNVFLAWFTIVNVMPS